jgi:4-diphosphocytidyl-2C-methyl-D-erythritol kinase
MLRDLKTLGADFSGLSGAGATCFGVFARQGEAEAAVRVLKKQWNFVCLTFFLARSANSVLQ